MKNRIERLRNSIDQLIDESVVVTEKLALPMEFCNELRDDMWNKNKTISNLIGDN